jgi:hypothetical protein
MKEATPPTPEEDEPAVNSIEHHHRLQMSSAQMRPHSQPTTYGMVMHLHLLEPSNCHRQF